MSISSSSSNRCANCGAPRTGDTSLPCAFCKAVQPAPPSDAALAAAVQKALLEDRDGNGVPDVLDAALRPAAPPSPSTPHAHLAPPAGPTAPSAAVILGFVGGITALVGMGVAGAVLAGSAPEHVPPPPEPPPAVATPAPPPTVAAPEPSAVVTTPPKRTAPAKPVTKLTNEQFGKNVVAAQNKKLRECVEQDLLRTPTAPKAYTVTVLVEHDGLPKNTATAFSPAPTKGFASCARHVIFYGFSGYGRSAPERVEFTFSTSFAFPDAAPAAKAQSGRGWD
ncbi:MAG: hypothetical protein KF894_21145 [Labilithrix sp.]|nr:hypothetical protein [Labilithrix sp.]